MDKLWAFVKKRFLILLIIFEQHKDLAWFALIFFASLPIWTLWEQDNWYRDNWSPGEYQASVDLDMREKARSIMANNRVERAADVRRQTPAPLKGLLFGPDGKAMTPTHTPQ